jgi:hypothetical protein
MNTGYLFYDQCARLVARSIFPLAIAVGSGFVASLNPVGPPATATTPGRSGAGNPPGPSSPSKVELQSARGKAEISPSMVPRSPLPATTYPPVLEGSSRPMLSMVRATGQPLPPRKQEPVMCEKKALIQGTFGSSVVYCHSRP